MFQKYKEIIFGIAFGFLVMMIDTAMDANVEGASLAQELTGHPGMMLYRFGFILLGLAFGWLLWRNHTRDREYRLLKEALQNFQQQSATQCLLLRSTLQVLLTRNDLHLPDEAQGLLRDAYQKSQELQRLAEEKLPITGA